MGTNSLDVRIGHGLRNSPSCPSGGVKRLPLGSEGWREGRKSYRLRVRREAKGYRLRAPDRVAVGARVQGGAGRFVLANLDAAPAHRHDHSPA